MNLDKWNSLPKDIKKTIEEISKEWVDVHGEVWDKGDAEGHDFTLSLGNEIILLSDKENSRWCNAIKSIIDDYIKAAKEKNLPGDKAVTEVKKLITEYSKIYR